MLPLQLLMVLHLSFWAFQMLQVWTWNKFAPLVKTPTSVGRNVCMYLSLVSIMWQVFSLPNFPPWHCFDVPCDTGHSLSMSFPQGWELSCFVKILNARISLDLLLICSHFFNHPVQKLCLRVIEWFNREQQIWIFNLKKANAEDFSNFSQ